MTGLDVREIPGRSVFWSVFDPRYPAASFNPNATGDPSVPDAGGRFNPLETPGGRRIATKYLADHPNGAFAETLLRRTSGSRDVSRYAIETHRIAQLSLSDPLLLVDLTETPTTSALGRLLRRGDVAYPPLRDFAATVHATRSDVAGLLWESRQLDLAGMNCMVLFEDRVSSSGSSLTLVREHELVAGIGLRLLRAAARARQFTIPADYALGRLVSRPRR